MSETLFIRSKKRPGFRRAGMYFPFEGVEVPVSELAEDRLKQLQAESRLAISEGGNVDTVPDENMEDIVEAIAMLDPDKKPNVKEVEGVLGFDITAAQRDKAWDVYQEMADQ